MTRTTTTIALAACATFALAGCSSDDASEGMANGGTAGPGAVGVTQGGSQDFGLFRQILEDGDIPGPDTIEDVGFFAEHKLDFPLPGCGEDLCMHGLLGAMGNMINGANCTLIQIGLNSPIDPNEVGRPPMHLVLAVDVSGSMTGEPINYLKAGLIEMMDELQPADIISLVKYSNNAEVVLEAVPAEQTATLMDAFNGLVATGSTNLFEGLFTAFELAEAHHDPSWQNHFGVV